MLLYEELINPLYRRDEYYFMKCEIVEEVDKLNEDEFMI